MNRKRTLLGCFCAAGLIASSSLALDITTREGTTYKHAEITGVDVDGLRITHEYGVAKVPFENLSESLQKKYHYDPAKVAAYRQTLKAQAEAKRALDSRLVQATSPSSALVTPTPNGAREAIPVATSLTGSRINPAVTGGTSSSQATALPAANFDNAIPLVAVLCVVVLAVVVSLRAASNAKKKQAALVEWHRRLESDLNTYIFQAKAAERLPTVPTNVLLKVGESAFYDFPAVLYETRAVRTYQAGRVGFRVAQGVWVGGTQGRSVSNQEWSEVDKGNLTVTNQRLLFDGNRENRSVALTKIISVHPSLDSVEVSVENRQKSMIFTRIKSLHRGGNSSLSFRRNCRQ